VIDDAWRAPGLRDVRLPSASSDNKRFSCRIRTPRSTLAP